MKKIVLFVFIGLFLLSFQELQAEYQYVEKTPQVKNQTPEFKEYLAEPKEVAVVEVKDESESQGEIVQEDSESDKNIKTENVEEFLAVTNGKSSKSEKLPKKPKKAAVNKPGSYFEVSEGVFKRAGGSEEDAITPYSGEWYLREKTTPTDAVEEGK